MSDAIIAEFRDQLAELAGMHRDRPHAELAALWALGLEREAIVSIVYRHDIIADRLRRMPLDPAARAVIARAVHWIWRDEEAHTLWVRGALIRRRELARALGKQLEGRLGGWVSSRQNHYAWREAPFTRLGAELLEAAAGLGGRIPPAVRETLHYKTFAAFCRFNISAETTAALAWRRMAELAESLGLADATGFLRMARDEERHARVFEILADAFDAGDRLRITADELRVRIQNIGQRFVAIPDPDRAAWRNRLGKGGTVVVREGSELAQLVDSILGATLEDVAGLSVALKTTFMLVTDRRDPSPGVSPAVVREVVGWLVARGASVRVIDGPNLYDVFHRGRSVAEVAAYCGFGEVVDADADQVPHSYERGMGIATLSRTWRDADLRIVLGKLRSHPTTTAMFALEAAEGLAARHDDHMFLDRRAERETAILMALDAAPPHLALLDAWEHVPDGLLGVLGTDEPLHPHRLYAARDAVALDAIAARHVGADPDAPGLFAGHAFDWFGDPRAATLVDGPDTPIAGFRLPTHSARTAWLSSLALPVFTHASGRGALFLPVFDEHAFPPVARESRALRLARSAIRRVVDDRRDSLVDRTLDRMLDRTLDRLLARRADRSDDIELVRDPRADGIDHTSANDNRRDRRADVGDRRALLPTDELAVAWGRVRISRITHLHRAATASLGPRDTALPLGPRDAAARPGPRDTALPLGPHDALDAAARLAPGDAPGSRDRTQRSDHAVVLLHGYPDTLQIWAQLAPLLATRHHVFAFDWPGLGASTPAPGAADPDARAEQLRAILDAAGLATVDLVAHDMGGPPALVFAARYPERVRRVTVMSSLLFGDAPTSLEIRVMRQPGLAAAAFKLAHPIVYTRSVASFLPDGDRLPAAIDADFRRAFDRAEVRDQLVRMCADYERALPALPDRYWQVRCPVHVVWAEHDHHFSPEHADRLCAILPAARRTIVPGARHWMALSRAPLLAELLADFLE